jgi:hypothetical protein
VLLQITLSHDGDIKLANENEMVNLQEKRPTLKIQMVTQYKTITPTISVPASQNEFIRPTPENQPFPNPSSSSTNPSLQPPHPMALHMVQEGKKVQQVRMAVLWIGNQKEMKEMQRIRI